MKSKLSLLASFFIGALLFSASAVYATSIFQVQQGGSGVGTLGASGLVTGNGINPVYTTATTSVTCSGNTTCTSFIAIGASPITISSSGGGSSTFGTSSLSALYPLIYTQSSSLAQFSTAFGTTTTWGVGNNGLVMTGSTGIPFVQATSSTIALSSLTLSVPLSVGNGGTGANTLTGCLTGNGTGAITGSGTCNTSNATVSSIAAGLGLNGGAITTSGTINLKSYIATSSAETANQIPAWTTTNGTPATLSGGFSGYTLTSTGLTATYASTTAISTSYASSTLGYFGTLTVPSLGTAAGTFVAADPTGKLIATSSPTGTNYWTLNGNNIYNNNNSGNGFVGIGTTTPPAILTVNTTSLASNPLEVWAQQYEKNSVVTVSTTTYTSGQTWTKPAGLVSATIYVIGGGGGGGGGDNNTLAAGSGGDGASSSFTYNSGGNTLIANGGVGGAGARHSGKTGAGGTASGGTTNVTGTAGTAGSGSTAGPGGGTGYSSSGGSAGTGGSAPGGAGGGGNTGNDLAGSGGGGGGFSVVVLTASQLGSTETITVGGGGGGGECANVSAGGNGGDATGSSGGSGGSGAGCTVGPGGNGGNGNTNGGNPGNANNGGGGAGGAVMIGTVVSSGGNVSKAFLPALSVGFVTATTTFGGSNYFATTSPALGIGTSTPSATFSEESFWGNIISMVGAVINGVHYVVEEIDQYGHLITGGAAPTCGTGCTSVTGDDRTMRVITGSTVSSATVNFANTYTTTPVCQANEESAGVVAVNASSTPSTVVLEFASALTSIRIGVTCQISNNFTY